MPATYPLTLSLTGMVTSITIRPKSSQAAVPSPFSFSTQVQDWGGRAWQADVAIRTATRASAETLIAQLVSLNSFEGSFLLGDTACKTARGTATGTPLVKGAGQTGTDLVTDGWTPGVATILCAGDWLQLGSGSTARLYKVTADVASNGSGEATIPLWPYLRSSPADNAAVTVSNAQGKFMLAAEPQWTISAERLYSFSFSAVEDLR